MGAGLTLFQAKDIVLTHLGRTASETYKSFFEGESPEEIESSVVEILTNLMGSEKAKQIISTAKESKNV